MKWFRIRRNTEKVELFQTRTMTAMDLWLLLCMLCVGTAIFEYGVLLAIRFGRGNKVNQGKKNDQKSTGERCNRIDRYALGVFMTVFALKVGAYTYVINSNY